MARPAADTRRLVLLVLRVRGPMSDAYLSHFLEMVYRVSGGSARRARRELVRRGQVARATTAELNSRGQLVSRWEWRG